MPQTTVRMDRSTRERLATLARESFGGITQEAALIRLIDDYEMRQVHLAYAALRADEAAWLDYRRELDEGDGSSADGLPTAREEYPEYNL